MQCMKYILNMCLIHLQSIKMKNRIRFKYCLGICLMQYVWNMLNIILEVIETFHTHSPCVLYVCTECALGPNPAPGTQPEYPGWGLRGSVSLAFPCLQSCSGPHGSPKEAQFLPSFTPLAHDQGVFIALVSLHLSALFLLNKLDPNLLQATGYQVTGYYFSSFQHIACQSGH